MKTASPERAANFEWRWLALCPLALGLGCAAVLLAARPLALLVLAGCSTYAVLAAISIRRPNICTTLFLAVVIALPPFYFSAFGETPVYVSTLLLPMGIGILLVRLPDLRLRLDPIGKGLLLFLIGTGLSLPFAWWLSGEVVGQQSLLRWLMVAHAAFMYFLVRGTSRLTSPDSQRRIVPILLLAAVATAGFGILDFYWPVNLPHPAADQFIWLRGSIVRRAQGTFFEAGNFANLCGVFLILTSAAYLARRERAVGVPRPWLLLSIVVLTLAVFLSFTRSTWVSIAVALLIFAAVSPEMKIRRAVGFFASLGIPLAVLWQFSPELWDHLITTRLGTLGQIFVEPNAVSSGRLETWGQVLSIIQDHPQYWLFGVGYKTLPFTRLFHQEIITDNGFLNLLLETGVLGLVGFVILSGAMVLTCLRMNREGDADLRFWSTLVLSVWCGEWVQMMAVDAHTYWRSMTVIFSLTALTLNRADEIARRAGVSPGKET